MLLDLIYGGIGTGKTERCIELIERTLKKNPGHNAVITVPDQYSYLTEKRMVEHFGGTGLNGVEVLTFSQMFKRFLDKADNYLSPSGKQMLLLRAAVDSCKEGVFARSVEKEGFVSKIAELISEMKHYLITPNDLKEAVPQGDDMLSEKTASVSDIYMAYEKLLQNDFCDSEDDFLRLAEYIKTSGKFEKTHIWFDGFSDFLPQHYEVIKCFLEYAASVHVSVCLPGEESGEIYNTPKETAEKLKKICNDKGARLYEQYCGAKCHTIESAELLHLMNNWENRKNVYPNKTKDISLFCARDLYSETEYIAKQIINEIKNGAEFSDIGIMCASPEKYEHLIEAIFSDYNIPYFIDSDKSVTEHPIALTVLGIFEIAEENWSYESVFKYLRTGFLYQKSDKEIIPYDREAIDRLENYVLRRGIRGKSRWFEQWTEKSGGVFDTVLGTKTNNSENLEEINSLRKEICRPFKNLYRKISGQRTVRELTEALFEFLCDIHMYDGINSEVNKLNKMQMRDSAERMKEVWNLIMDVLDQAVITSGEEMCSRQNFVRLIREGLSKSSMKIIPPGPDVISIGSADRNAAARPKIVFFMGAVNGTMPSEVKNKSIFTDKDRKALESFGLETAGTSQKKSEKEAFKFFRAVTSAGKKLYFSYPTSDSDGAAQQPAAFIKNLYKLFPKLNISDDLIESKPSEINNEKEAFGYIMRAVSDKKMQKNAHLLVQSYKDSEYLKEKLPLVNYAAVYKKKQPQILAESAKLLYNNYHRYSVSRLNDYSACPFAYYVKHGLKAQEQEVWKIQKFDIGSLLHWAVCEYCREVGGRAQSLEDTKKRWHELTDDESAAIIDKIIEEITERTMKGLKRDREKIAYLLERMRKILIRSVDIVRLSLVCGDYSAVCYEEQFRIDIDWMGKTVGINGTMDRADASEKPDEGTISLRVIDYKSGSKNFDVVSISNRSDMQLVVYAIAAVELYKKGALGRASKGLKPSVRGILYNKLRNDTVSCKESDVGKIDDIIRKQMKLDGAVIVDKDNEIAAAAEMDRSIENGGSSRFLKLAVNSKGDSLNKKTSGYMTTDKFEILTDYVKKSIVTLDDEIFSGRIDIMPSGSGKKKACSYCKYKEICLYDSALHGTKTGISKDDAAWAYMETEVNKDAAEKLDG